MADTITGIRVLAAMVIERDWPTFREPDNADRSAMAAETLCYFARQTGLARSDESVDTIMVDLITDLMHLCDKLDIDFSGVLTVSAMHYDDESKG
ncbi:hypothetical protein FHU10_5284 [Serratia fonticola]|uniref:Uncharacterized protein n=1 Tax=Serratia fonticola TaxID=47917 RepID=A0A542BFG0_SERFO|nr:hypothetical protein [Serratia fonticola]TQI77316.1 hypothetical protein FHU09_5314 [Serratia fonticola]TQI93639.1 hypothetical protein FHU11_5332 [Serratia fonticola]TVZ61588.1 hypothetical protein FHU10_5284 [Serratia fonticola]